MENGHYKRPVNEDKQHFPTKRRFLSAKHENHSPAGTTFKAEYSAFLVGKKQKKTKLPTLGFKELDLYAFYRNVQNLGGYDEVTRRRLWRQVYIELGSNPSSTSAATCARKHYERLLLPFERYKKELKYGKNEFYKSPKDNEDALSNYVSTRPSPPISGQQIIQSPQMPIHQGSYSYPILTKEKYKEIIKNEEKVPTLSSGTLVHVLRTKNELMPNSRPANEHHGQGSSTKQNEKIYKWKSAMLSNNSNISTIQHGSENNIECNTDTGIGKYPKLVSIKQIPQETELSNENANDEEKSVSIPTQDDMKSSKEEIFTQLKTTPNILPGLTEGKLNSVENIAKAQLHVEIKNLKSSVDQILHSRISANTTQHTMFDISSEAKQNIDVGPPCTNNNINTQFSEPIVTNKYMPEPIVTNNYMPNSTNDKLVLQSSNTSPFQQETAVIRHILGGENNHFPNSQIEKLQTAVQERLLPKETNNNTSSFEAGIHIVSFENETNSLMKKAECNNTSEFMIEQQLRPDQQTLGTNDGDIFVIMPEYKLYKLQPMNLPANNSITTVPTRHASDSMEKEDKLVATIKANENYIDLAIADVNNQIPSARLNSQARYSTDDIKSQHYMQNSPNIIQQTISHMTVTGSSLPSNNPDQPHLRNTNTNHSANDMDQLFETKLAQQKTLNMIEELQGLAHIYNNQISNLLNGNLKNDLLSNDNHLSVNNNSQEYCDPHYQNRDSLGQINTNYSDLNYPSRELSAINNNGEAPLNLVTRGRCCE